MDSKKLERERKDGYEMGIDFHSEENRNTYTTRKADNSWNNIITRLVNIGDISNALDVGCGGRIYTFHSNTILYTMQFQ